MLQNRSRVALILLIVFLAACSATPSTTPAATTAPSTNSQPMTAIETNATRDPNAPLPFDDVSDIGNTNTQGTFTIAVGASSVVLPNIGGNWVGGDFTTTNADSGLVLRVDIVRGLASNQTALAYAQATYPTGDEAELIAGTEFFVKRDEVAQTTRLGRKVDSTTVLVLTFEPLSDAAVLETQFDLFLQMLREAEVR